MRYYRLNGNLVCTSRALDAEELTKQEYDDAKALLGAKAEIRGRITEKRRPLTTEEVTSMLITQQVNALVVDDNTALRMKTFYPSFNSVIGQTVKQGFKFTYADKLWRVVQPELLMQAHFPPSVGTESLYEEICETHDGTLEDPIPYSGNMELFEGKYYMQEYVIYVCIRSSCIALHHPLAELIGQYVEEAC